MNIVARSQSLILAGETSPPRRAVALSPQAPTLQRVTLVATQDDAPLLLHADFYPPLEATGLPTTVVATTVGDGARRSLSQVSLGQYTAQGAALPAMRKGTLLDVLA